ncbi:MAG: PH domain-containing protein [Actinomycetota bacterium]
MARSFLTPGEEVVRTTRKHLSVLARPALATLVLVALLGALGWFTGPRSGADVVAQVCGGLAALLMLRLALRVRRWSSERILVTDRRIVFVGGTMARRVSSWPYVRIHDLGLRRSVVGRLLGYGSVLLEPTVPGAAPASLERIPDPQGFYRDVMEALMEGPLPEMVDLDRDPPDEQSIRAADEADTGPLPRVIV